MVYKEFVMVPQQCIINLKNIVLGKKSNDSIELKNKYFSFIPPHI